jgi:hypothetical protein
MRQFVCHFDARVKFRTQGYEPVKRLIISFGHLLYSTIIGGGS